MAYGLEKYGAKYSQKQPYFGPDVEAKAIPSPTGGWDAISPLSAMDPKYAVSLTNWVPRPGFVELRGGYNVWAQRISSTPVETLMCYRPANSAEKLFAATGGSIYDVSSYAMPVLATSGKLNARWQFVNMTPAGSNSFLLAVNGQDSYLAYNGVVWSNPTITGIVSSTFVNINLHKKRLWFIPVNSTSAWYLATDAISGTAFEFPLGSFMSKGGKLVAMATWTVDGGNGPDDQALFITSKGQVILYKGTDPASANTWALVGVFSLPPPIGNRCFISIGGELAIITTQGLIPVSQALPFDPAGVRSVALTNRIQNAMLISAQLGSSMFGWSAITFNAQTLLIMNIPQQENVTQVQYVMNLLTGAWTQFTGWNANCFETFNESLYFGDNVGNVNLAYAASLDLVTPIQADMKCAFNYFDDPGRIKNLTMLKPLLIADGTLTPTVSIDVDFADASPAAPLTIITPAGAKWDLSNWDQAQWSTGASTVNNWLSVTAIGTALATRLKVNVSGVAGSSASAAQSSVFDTGVFDTMLFDGNGAITQSGTGLVTLQLNMFEAILQFGGPI